MQKPEEVADMAAPETEKTDRIGAEVREMRGRMTALETNMQRLELTTGRHGNDLGDLKALIAKLDVNLQHQSQIFTMEITGIKDQIRAEVVGIREQVKAEIGRQFLSHEKREAEAQRKVLAWVIVLVLSTLGAILMFLLQRVQFS